MLRPQSHAGSASAGEQQRQQLQSNPAWEASRFGDLETFIFDFLSGAAGGEGVRLKLQTPLNISQALLDAATQQVQDDLEVAKQVGPGPKVRRCREATHWSQPPRFPDNLAESTLPLPSTACNAPCALSSGQTHARSNACLSRLLPGCEACDHAAWHPETVALQWHTNPFFLPPLCACCRELELAGALKRLSLHSCTGGASLAQAQDKQGGHPCYTTPCSLPPSLPCMPPGLELAGLSVHSCAGG